MVNKFIKILGKYLYVYDALISVKYECKYYIWVHEILYKVDFIKYLLGSIENDDFSKIFTKNMKTHVCLKFSKFPYKKSHIIEYLKNCIELVEFSRLKFKSTFYYEMLFSTVLYLQTKIISVFVYLILFAIVFV